jgi:hypothetical protein
MDERSRIDSRIIALAVVIAAIGGVWWLLHRPPAQAALESAADVVAPAPDSIGRGLNAVGEARSIVDQINARPAAPPREPR